MREGARQGVRGENVGHTVWYVVRSRLLVNVIL